MSESIRCLIPSGIGCCECWLQRRRLPRRMLLFSFHFPCLIPCNTFESPGQAIDKSYKSRKSLIALPTSQNEMDSSITAGRHGLLSPRWLEQIVCCGPLCAPEISDDYLCKFSGIEHGFQWYSCCSTEPGAQYDV